MPLAMGRASSVARLKWPSERVAKAVAKVFQREYPNVTVAECEPTKPNASNGRHLWAQAASARRLRIDAVASR